MYIHQKSSKAKQDNKNMYSGSQCVSMASWILTVYPYIYISACCPKDLKYTSVQCRD